MTSIKDKVAKMIALAQGELVRHVMQWKREY